MNKADKFRYHECTQIVKKVKDDDGSKFDLLKEKSLAQITSNIDKSPETKANVCIVDHPSQKKTKCISKKNTIRKNTAKPTENRPNNTSKNQKTLNVSFIKNASGTWRVESIEPSKERSNMNKSSCDEPDHPIDNNGVVKSKNNEESRKNNPAETEEKTIKEENVEEERAQKVLKENENPISAEKVTKRMDPCNEEYLSVNVASNTTNVEDMKKKKKSKSQSLPEIKSTTSDFQSTLEGYDVNNGASIKESLLSLRPSKQERISRDVEEYLKKISGMKNKYQQKCSELDRSAVKKVEKLSFQQYLHHSISIEFEIVDQKTCRALTAATQYIMNLKFENFSPGHLCSAHKILMSNHFHADAGKYRKEDVCVLSEGEVVDRPPAGRDVDKYMELFFQHFHDIMEDKDMDIVTKATIIKTQFVFVHPFLDGNGRLSRILMNWVIRSKGYPFTTILSQKIAEYYSCIKQAKNGNLSALINFVCDCISSSLLSCFFDLDSSSDLFW